MPVLNQNDFHDADINFHNADILELTETDSEDIIAAIKSGVILDDKELVQRFKPFVRSMYDNDGEWSQVSHSFYMGLFPGLKPAELALIQQDPNNIYALGYGERYDRIIESALEEVSKEQALAKKADKSDLSHGLLQKYEIDEAAFEQFQDIAREYNQDKALKLSDFLLIAQRKRDYEVAREGKSFNYARIITADILDFDMLKKEHPGLSKGEIFTKIRESKIRPDARFQACLNWAEEKIFAKHARDAQYEAEHALEEQSIAEAKRLQAELQQAAIEQITTLLAKTVNADQKAEQQRTDFTKEEKARDAQEAAKTQITALLEKLTSTPTPTLKKSLKLHFPAIDCDISLKAISPQNSFLSKSTHAVAVGSLMINPVARESANAAVTPTAAITETILNTPEVTSNGPENCSAQYPLRVAGLNLTNPSACGAIADMMPAQGDGWNKINDVVSLKSLPNGDVEYRRSGLQVLPQCRAKAPSSIKLPFETFSAQEFEAQCTKSFSDAHTIKQENMNAMISGMVFSGGTQQEILPVIYALSKWALESRHGNLWKSPHSSARGLNQFIVGTWIQVMRENGEVLGLEDSDRILREIDQVVSEVGLNYARLAKDSRIKRLHIESTKDPHQSAVLGIIYSMDGLIQLQAALDSGRIKHPDGPDKKYVTPQMGYAAHFLGLSGAVDFFNGLAEDKARGEPRTMKEFLPRGPYKRNAYFFTEKFEKPNGRKITVQLTLEEFFDKLENWGFDKTPMTGLGAFDPLSREEFQDMRETPEGVTGYKTVEGYNGLEQGYPSDVADIVAQTGEIPARPIPVVALN